jgi:hypothetical protein
MENTLSRSQNETTGIKEDEAGLLIDLDRAQRNRDMIEQMRRLEREEAESKNDGRQRNYNTQAAIQKNKMANRFW